MSYPVFNELGLSDAQVDAIKDSISKRIGSYETTVDDRNAQFVVYERMIGTESRGLLLRIKTTAARFHFFVNLWKKPSENGRLKLKAYLEDQGADSWQFKQQGIELSVKNKKGNETWGNVFYFVPSDTCHCKNFSVTAVYEHREALGCLAKSILDKLNAVDYFTVDYSGCRLAEEGDDVLGVSHGNSSGVSIVPNLSGSQSETNEELVDNVLAPEGDPFPEGCQAVVVTVERLLRMNLRIPEYQRPYKWTRRSVEELMQDIRDSVEIPDGPESMPLKYRLGTVILDASSTDGGFDVVDGQQRILTLLLINRVLNEIRKNKVSCPLLEDGVTMKVLSRSRVSRKNLHENYAVVKSCLARDYELRKKLVVAFNSTLEMVVVKVDELSEAFQLFDSQNTRGRALDPHDLLKAFHLRAMAQKAKAQGMVAEKAEEEMRSVVTEWEAQSEESLRSLFDNWLFRISNWSRKRRTHPFSAADIHEFKGVPFDSEYSFALRAKAAMPRGDDAASRRFQIGEDFEEGREFFRMVSHYLRMVEAAKSDALFKDRPEIKNVLKLADGKGFSHVENMFRCALMSYVDRFGEDALSDPRVVDKLCLWAFILRLDMNHVSEDSINKYAVIEGGADYTNTIPMFSVIKTARTPSDIAIQDVCGVSGSRYKRKQGVKGREQLQNALKKVEA